MKICVRLAVPALTVTFLFAGARTAAATNFDVFQSGFGFTPQNVTIQLGDSVTWHWANQVHTVTEGTDGTVDGNEAFHSPLNFITQTFAVTFNAAFVGANPRPGNLYDYFCVNHFPEMIGTVTVITEPGAAYCFGDGLDPMVTATCPCANVGDPGRGCANSNAALGGAKLGASGTTNPNTVLFTCDGLPNNTLTAGLRGTANDPAGFLFGDGVACATGTIVRFGQHNSGSNGDAPNTWAASTATVAPGNTRYYQVQYRNPAPGFCPPETFNASNAYAIVW